MGAVGSTEPGMSSYVSENAKKRMGRTLPPVSETTEEDRKKVAADSAQKANGVPTTAVARSVDLGVGWESFTEESRALRNGFLEYVQAHPLGSKPSRRFQRKKVVKDPPAASVSQKPSFITFSYPRYINRDIVVPAPSDMVTLEVDPPPPSSLLDLFCRCGQWLPFSLSSIRPPSSPS
jgi:hypothetical protein